MILVAHRLLFSEQPALKIEGDALIEGAVGDAVV
jgi:hypothetical protein